MHKYEINTQAKPRHIITPKIGLTSKLDTKKVTFTVLKKYAVIGIIKHCAEKHTHSISFILLLFLITFLPTFANAIIPIVPAYESINPISSK